MWSILLVCTVCELNNYTRHMIWTYTLYGSYAFVNCALSVIYTIISCVIGTLLWPSRVRRGLYICNYTDGMCSYRILGRLHVYTYDYYFIVTMFILCISKARNICCYECHKKLRRILNGMIYESAQLMFHYTAYKYICRRICICKHLVVSDALYAESVPGISWYALVVCQRLSRRCPLYMLLGLGKVVEGRVALKTNMWSWKRSVDMYPNIYIAHYNVKGVYGNKSRLLVDIPSHMISHT